MIWGVCFNTQGHEGASPSAGRRLRLQFPWDSGTAPEREARTNDLKQVLFVRYPLSCLVLSCLLALYTAVMSFEILFPFGLWVFEPGWLFNHSQLV